MWKPPKHKTLQINLKQMPHNSKSQGAFFTKMSSNEKRLKTLSNQMMPFSYTSARVEGNREKLSGKGSFVEQSGAKLTFS